MRRVTEKEYKQAVGQIASLTNLTNQYHKQLREDFEQRLKENPIFTDEELRYSRTDLCPCGHGIAYPKTCHGGYHWDCSAILKGIASKDVEHTAKLPFMFYDIKGENEKMSTRGVFRPRDGRNG